MLVGNAPPQRDYTALIHSADTIIRFNKVQYLPTGRVGMRTDILFAQNMEPDWLEGRLPRLQQRETWILAENPQRDKTAAIVEANRLDPARVRTIYSDHFPQVAELQIRGVSSGFAALLVLLADARYRDVDLHLCCFTWQGWKGHAWDIERGFCYGVQAAGRLRIHV